MAFIPSGRRSQALDDGSHISVIGGGPSGSFFSIFALKMAKIMGREISVTIFEPKTFAKDGPAGCNRCGGIISELLVQTLAVEGISLPDTIVRKGIHSYCLHTLAGDVTIQTPELEKTIATVSRNGGPLGMAGHDKESFDQFLLGQAIAEGAIHRPLRIERAEHHADRVVLSSQDQIVAESDLVVGAFGINSTTPKLVQDLGFGYQEPETVTTAIAELVMEQETVRERFGDSIHLFLLPDRELKFAAMIPKGPYVTLCILGRDVTAAQMNAFLDKQVVRSVLPDPAEYRIACRCLPKMNVGAPRIPFTDRFVMCGDAGSTRLFKDGLGAAYLMGKAAAKTAVFDGVGAADFRKGYLPAYRSIVTDNLYGRVVYFMIDRYRSLPLVTRAMVETVRHEQADSGNREKILSTILWDMFTGNERYRNVFMKSLKCRMHIDMWKGLFRALGRRTS